MRGPLSAADSLLPTTAGTGSEVADFHYHHRNGQQMGVVSPLLLLPA
jgi:alcohol dehydrogenase class IV